MAVGFAAAGGRADFNQPRSLADAYVLFTKYPWIGVEYLAVWLVMVNMYAKQGPFMGLPCYDISVADCYQGYAFNFLLVEFFYKGCEKGYFMLPGGGPGNAAVGYIELMALKHQNAQAQMAHLGSLLPAIPKLKGYFFKMHDAEPDGAVDFDA